MPTALRILIRCIFATALLFVSATCLQAQSLQKPPWKSEIAKGYLPYHRLVAGDFPINDGVHPANGMYTCGFLHSFYRDECIVKDGRATDRITEWTVWSGFDQNKSSRKSWYKFVAETLPHEQGHLDINELYGRHLAKMPLSKLAVGHGSTAEEAHADLVKRIQMLSDRVGEELANEQRKYDAETDHGQNSARQREWTASIQKRLTAAGIHF